VVQIVVHIIAGLHCVLHNASHVFV